MEIQQFLDHLSSDTPTPGGGCASALAGALSASLIMMVAGLSSKKGQSENKEMRGIKKRARVIRQKLYRAIGEDAQSFDAVMKAFRLPKDKEKERLYRSRRIQKAYQMATVTPQKVCELSVQLLEFSKLLLKKGNQNAFSDTGVAAYLANAALEGGMLNIRINLGAIKGELFKKGKERLIRRLLQKRDRLIGEIQEEIKSY
ncbi:MAG TPA: cyclodeaminase/cyclohydrolase family protein [Thermodesulfobacteriota bacterium]|nr:cyclodeaminase/cyclohydrolase family protein [Thermodesulfobacteriota bacterium]